MLSSRAWAEKTPASAELRIHPNFLPDGRKIEGRKMGDHICFQGTSFCHQFFCQSAFAMVILVGPGGA
jgi:hypothetical protein